LSEVKVKDVNLYYEVHGEGVPLLMIQGLSGNIYWYWDQPLLDELSKHFKVIIFDNRGVGRSDNLEGILSVEIMANDALGLLDALNINQSHILGHSLGGMVAQELTLKFPERVSRLVLYGTSCGGSKAELPSIETQKILTRLSTRGHTKLLVKKAIPHIFSQKFIEDNPEFIETKIDDMLKMATSPTTFQAQMGAWMRFSSCRKLKVLDIPTLILHGKKDIIVPPGNAKLLAEKIPNAEVVFFDSSAHMTHTEEPEKFNDALIKFLK